ERERPVLAESSITSTLANEKQCPCFLEKERACSRLLIGFGTRISAGHETDSGNRHLSIEHPLDAVIHLPLQGQGTQWFPVMVAWLRECMLHLSECLKCAFQVLFRLY